MLLHFKYVVHGQIQRGGGHSVRILLKNHKNIGFLSKTGLDLIAKLQGYQASIQCWATIDSSVKRLLTGVFRWRADGGPLLVVFGSSSSIAVSTGLKFRHISPA